MTDTDNFIKCRDGVDREIFPALIKHKDRVRHFALKFRSDMAILNILAPDLNAIGNPEMKEFTDEPYDAMMEILYLAFGEKYKKEEIEEWIDVAMVPEIVETFFGISGYKKKAKHQTPELAGVSSALPL